MRVRHLFVGIHRLSDVLAAAARDAEDRLAARPPDDLLNRTEADLTEQLIEVAMIEAPSLVRHMAYLEPSTEVRVDTISTM
jgi:hypothetical protein